MSTLRLTIELHTDDGLAHEVLAASVPCPVPHPHPAKACSDLHRLAPVTRVARGLTAILEQLTSAPPVLPSDDPPVEADPEPSPFGCADGGDQAGRPVPHFFAR